MAQPCCYTLNQSDGNGFVRRISNKAAAKSSAGLPWKVAHATISTWSRLALGDGGDNSRPGPVVSRSAVHYVYHNGRPVWNRKAYQYPVRHNCSELSYSCPTGWVRPLRGQSRTCVEAALKTSSTLLSIEELPVVLKWQVSAKAQQRSFLLHHRSYRFAVFLSENVPNVSNQNAVGWYIGPHRLVSTGALPGAQEPQQLLNNVSCQCGAWALEKVLPSAQIWHQ